MKKELLSALLILIAMGFDLCFANLLDKEKVFEQLCSKFAGVSALKVQFKMVNGGYSGSLLFSRPNKFRLELMRNNRLERVIISNGKTLWNYSPGERRVVLSLVENSDRVDLQNIFADFANKFVPISLAKENVSYLGSFWGLSLRLKEDETQSVKLYLDNKMQIKAIAFANGRDTLVYSITRLQLNPKTSGRTFEFTPSEGVEVIDLR